MEEIIVIRAADPDGSVFKAVVDALKGKRAEVVSVAAPVSSMLFTSLGEFDKETNRMCVGTLPRSAHS